jgi:ATP-dependent Clp protease ATP-binding subunit ClpX
MSKTTLHCSFCGRSRDEVKILIAGQEGHICEGCVDHAREIVEQEVTEKGDGKSGFKLLSLFKPKSPSGPSTGKA